MRAAGTRVGGSGGGGDKDPLLVGEIVVDTEGASGSSASGIEIADFSTAFPDVADGFQGSVWVRVTIVGSNTLNSPGRAYVDTRITATYTTGGGWSFASPSNRTGDDGGVTSVSLYFAGPPKLRISSGTTYLKVTGVVSLYGTADVPEYP